LGTREPTCCPAARQPRRPWCPPGDPVESASHIYIPSPPCGRRLNWTGALTPPRRRCHRRRHGEHMRPFELIAIGRVESPLTDLQSAPRQPDEGGPEGGLVLE